MMPFTPDQQEQQPQSGFVPDDQNVPRATIPADVAPDAFKAGVHGKMLDVSPGYAYQNRDEVDKQLRAVSPDYDSPELDPGILNDLKTAYEGSILGLTERKKLPEQERNPNLFHKTVTGLFGFLADTPFIAAGAISGAEGGPVGIAAGSFALPAVAREALVQGIRKGDIKSFGDLARRMAAVTWTGTKAALTGAAFEAGGELAPAVGPVAARLAVKGLYQATAMTTAGDLLDGKTPNASDFVGNAAIIVPLNLITHGVSMLAPEAKQATMDVYAKDGTTPQETAGRLQAQPPVKPDLPEGLRPAISVGDSVVDGDTTESHADLAERALAKKPVSMEELEADPSRADEVLEAPAIHEQSVIDKAWQLKSEAIDAGEVEAPEGEEKPTSIEDLYDRSTMKSGRGFVNPNGDFLTRMEAKEWVKKNEPDVHEMWQQEQNGDKQAELHSQDYAEARNRVQGRNVAEGDPVIANVSPQNTERLAAAREGLNKIKAGDSSKGYGKEVLRTLFVGQRDTRIAETTQLRDNLQKLIPDFHDQEALSILRDYKGTPGKLVADLERIRTEGNEREKALLPSIERAMNPTPELLEADRRLTDYYTSALNEGRELGFMESRIDPSHYSPHILTRILEGEKPSVGRGGPMAKSTPFAKERSYPTILDALKTEKLDARTVNALDALSVYGDRHATVVATKILSRELSNTELGKYGTQENHPDGWVEMAPGQGVFRTTIAITDKETGDPHVVSRSLYVPKDVADAMKPMFESGLKGTILAPLLKSQGYVKMLELGLSFFHVKALNITAMNNMGLTNTIKSMASEVDPVAEKEWAADGLTTAKTSTPYEAYEGLKKSSVPTGFDKLANLPVIKQADALAKAITEYTFDVVQRSRKVSDASLKAASWMAKHQDATQEEYFAARRSIAKEVNAAYGGLNWDVLGKGKTFRDVSRLFLLAPDWTFSNVLNAKYSFEGGPAGSAARMFWAKSFATGIGMTAAMSIAIGGKYDPTDVKHLDQVYLGKDEKGKEMYANWFFAGAPKDAMTLAKRVASDSPIAGTAEFVVSKAAPLIGILGGLSFNKQPTGAPIYKKADSGAKKFGEQAGFVAERTLPISGVSAVQGVSQALTDPTHEWSYKDLLGLAADLLGSPTYHEGTGPSSKSTPLIPGSRSTKGGMAPKPGKSKFSIRGGR